MFKGINTVMLSLAVVLVAFVGGCGGGDDSPSNARLRVLHASPDAPNVDVYLDNSVLLSNVPYPTVSNYITLNSGTHNIKINAAGTQTTVINVTPDLAKDNAYTAIAANFVANIQPLLTTDETAPAPAGQVRLRVIHAAPDAGLVDILVNDKIVLSSVPFGTVSAYLTVAAGTYNVKVNLAGTATTAIQATISPASGGNYSAVAIGSVKTSATNPLALKVLTDG